MRQPEFGEPTRQLNVRIPQSLYDRLRLATGRRRDATMTGIVIAGLEAYVKWLDENPSPKHPKRAI